MMLYISARDHARKLKFSSYVHLPSINKILLRLTDSVRCIGEVIIFEHGCYISALAHTRMLIFSIFVLLEGINTIYKYGHAWVI